MFRNVPKLISDIKYEYFHHSSLSKQVYRAKCVILVVFSHFWRLLLLANLRGYIPSEILIWRQNMKIWCLEHLWVPSVHRKYYWHTPWKLRRKFFNFQLWNFLAFFASICPVFLSNALKIKFWTFWDQGYSIGPLGTLRSGCQTCWIGPFLTRINPKWPKMLWNQFMWFRMFRKSYDSGCIDFLSK